jgi:hypothetical protein
METSRVLPDGQLMCSSNALVMKWNGWRLDRLGVQSDHVCLLSATSEWFDEWLEKFISHSVVPAWGYTCLFWDGRRATSNSASRSSDGGRRYTSIFGTAKLIQCSSSSYQLQKGCIGHAGLPLWLNDFHQNICFFIIYLFLPNILPLI